MTTKLFTFFFGLLVFFSPTAFAWGPYQVACEIPAGTAFNDSDPICWGPPLAFPFGSKYLAHGTIGITTDENVPHGARFIYKECSDPTTGSDPEIRILNDHFHQTIPRKAGQYTLHTVIHPTSFFGECIRIGIQFLDGRLANTARANIVITRLP